MADDRELLLADYRYYLYRFCKQSAYLQDMKERIEDGGAVSEKEMVSHLSTLDEAADKLLEMKEALGFEGGLDFTDDCCFQGFKYENGILTGEFDLLPQIVLPWIRNFDEENYFTYEVGMLLMFHYKVREKRVDEEERKVRKKERRKMRVRRFLRFWRDFFMAFLGADGEEVEDEDE